MRKQQPNKIESQVTTLTIQDWLSQGKSRNFIIDRLMEQGFAAVTARDLYYAVIREYVPDASLIDDHKKMIIQQNLDRLEKIIETCIDGNTGDKKVALNAIAELNKMCGVYESNKVTIAKNQGGDEIIQISFDK